LADGMTEGLITDLSGISTLKVISRTSVMQYKKSDKSLPEIARELHVDGIVEGSVVRDGNAVRTTTQLIYAPEDKNVWAHSYDRQFQDLLTLQSEVASAIAAAVRAQIEPDEQARLQHERPINPKALEAYLQGNYHLRRYGFGSGHEEEEKANEYFHQAIAEDPGFARAYAALGDKASLEKALALDPNLSDVHDGLAGLKECDWDWVGAEREYRRAIELDPNNANAHEAFGVFLMEMGRIEEGLKEQEWAQGLDPNSSMLFMGLYYARQYDRNIVHVTEALAVKPTAGYLHYSLAMSYAQKGMHKEAIEHWKAAARLFGGEFTGVPEAMDRGYAASGYAGAMRATAKAIERLHDPSDRGFIPDFYALAGDKEEALKWLQKLYEEHDAGLISLGIDPVWDPLRSDPRFQDLVRGLALPEINVAALNTH
jgi:TolB-like protein